MRTGSLFRFDAIPFSSMVLRGTHRVGRLGQSNGVAVRLSTRRTKMNATAYNPKILPSCLIPLAGRAFSIAVCPIGWGRER